MGALTVNASSPLLPPGRFAVDPETSIVGFRIRHFGFSTVEGRFERRAGSSSATRSSVLDLGLAAV